MRDRTPWACDGRRASVANGAQVEWADMVECYLARELQHAGQALHAAYEQARAIGYRPGSPEMHRLKQAEEHYQQRRQRWQHYVGQSAAAEQQVGDSTPLGCGQAHR